MVVSINHIILKSKMTTLTVYQLAHCGSPTSPSNGSVLLARLGITTYGAFATQRCAIGYDLTGVTNIRCTADGTWCGPAVICTIKGKLPITRIKDNN